VSGQPEHRNPDELSVPEKVLRVQDLWDDIVRSPRDVEITPVQREEAERRLLAHESNPQEYPSWEEIKRRLERGR
jgi:putative addiction module component (TIGR02574 family)